jgi:thioredoxin-like negative regulator of GroEL
MRRVECLYKLGQVMEAYAELPAAESTFRQLALALAADKKPDELAQLVAEHARRFPDAKEIPFWTGEVHFLKNEHAKAAEFFATFENDPSPASPERFRTAERLVRCYLRAGNLPAAQQIVDASPKDRIPDSLRCAVFAALGDVATVETYLRTQRNWTGAPSNYHNDIDFAREFARPAFDILRKEFPKP